MSPLRVECTDVRERAVLCTKQTSAAAFASETDTAFNAPDSAYEQQTVSSVKVNGQTLTQGDYIRSNSKKINEGTLSAETGYAQFNDGRLLLNNFELNVAKDGPSAIEALSSTNDTQVLYIDIVGENIIKINSLNNAAAISACGKNGKSGADIVFSSKTDTAKLDSKLSAISVESDNNIKIKSGNYSFNGISASGGCDVIVSGGNVDIKSNANSADGISSPSRFVLNGGFVKFTGCKSGINSKSIIVNDGQAYFYNCTTSLYSKNSIIVNGGKIFIDSNNKTTTGLYSEDGNIEINGGDIEIRNQDKAIVSGENGNIDINGGKTVITDLNQGLFSMNDFTMNGGSLTVKNGTENAIFASNNIIINDGLINIENVNSDADILDNHGIERGFALYAYGNGLTINGGDITISGVKYGLCGYSSLSINDALADITAGEIAVKSGLSVPSVKNSDVIIRANGSNSKYTAFWPTVKVSGNPVIYAGSTERNSAKVNADNNDLTKYRYIHICKDSSSENNNTSTVFNSLFNAIIKLHFSSILSHSFFGRLLGFVII